MIGVQRASTFLSQAVLVSLIHWVSMLIPLITMPILVKAIGVLAYGELAVCVAFSSYVLLFIDFGFNWSGTRQIAQAKNLEEAKKIFWSIQLAKAVLSLVGMACVFIILNSFDIFQPIRSLTILACLMSSIGNWFHVGWYLRGQNKLLRSGGILFVGRLVQVLFVLTFVRLTGDIFFAVLAESIAIIITGVLCIRYFIVNWHGVQISYLDIKNQIFIAMPFFTTILSTSLFTTANPIILSFFVNNEVIGLFSVAEKIILAFKRIIQPLSMVMYPRLVKLSLGGITKLINETKIFAAVLLGWGVVAWIMLFFIPEKLIIYWGAEKYLSAVFLIRILSLVPLLSIIGHISGYHILVPNNKEVLLSRVFLLCGGAGFFVSWLMAFYMGAEGVAISVLIIEGFIAAFASYFAVKLLRQRLRD